MAVLGRIALAALAVALVASVLWFAGEQHRANCLRAERVDCSVLPWESGTKKKSPEENPFARGEESLLDRRSLLDQ